MLTSTKLIRQLKTLVGIAIGVIIAAAIFIGGYLVEQSRQSQQLHQQLISIKQTAAILHELQIERGLTGGFIGSRGLLFAKKLQLQRANTDAVLAKTKHVNGFEIFTTDKQIKLSNVRKYIDAQLLSSSESFDSYTKLIASMRSNYLAQVITVRHFALRNQLEAYTSLMTVKESMGQMRGAMNTIAAKHFIDHSMFLRIAYARAELDVARERFSVMASPEKEEMFTEISTSKEFNWTIHEIDAFMVHPNSAILVDPSVWFDRATVVINRLHTLEESYFATFDMLVNHELQISRTLLLYGAIVLLSLVTVLLFLGYKIARSIEKNIRLLNDYKHAVDRSSIVSKTTSKGVITYVNDKFSEISGYTKDELIGQSHNIVRHPDMSKEMFEEMWRTIGNKQPWNGVIKNLKKDGSSYWVEATINPILDNQDNVEEFIAIRNDITEAIYLRGELEKTQEDMIMRVGNIGETRSLETGKHVRRVAEYSRILAVQYGLSEKEIRYLADASPMHDIGKIGIPDTILQKSGPLTDEEWVHMRTHCEIGYHFFYDSDSPLLKAAAIIAYEHHEKWDGTGYPRRLKGEDIHIYGRITAIADVFDALGSDRYYKKAWENERIFELFRNERGKHFDPALIDIFFKHIDKFLTIQAYYSDKSTYMKEIS